MTGDRQAACVRCGIRLVYRRDRLVDGRTMCAACASQRMEERANGWQARAACRGEDSDIFYASDNYKTNSRATEQARVEAAKAICACCPVVEECLDAALATHEQYGVWGGMTAAERERLRPHARRVSRDGGGWKVIDDRGQQARTASLDAALDFARRLAPQSTRPKGTR